VLSDNRYRKAHVLKSDFVLGGGGVLKTCVYVYCSAPNKRRGEPGGKDHTKTLMNREACEAQTWTLTHHVPVRQMIHIKGYINRNHDDASKNTPEKASIH